MHTSRGDGVILSHYHKGHTFATCDNIRQISCIADPAIAADVDIWKIPIEEIQEEYVGYSHVFLDGSRETCRMTECNLGK